MTTGWVVAVTWLKPDGTPVSELYDCAIPHFQDAEEAVRKLHAAEQSAAFVSAVEPMVSTAVSSLGLEPGQVRKRT